jgi:hypothetical protein
MQQTGGGGKISLSFDYVIAAEHAAVGGATSSLPAAVMEITKV